MNTDIGRADSAEASKERDYIGDASGFFHASTPITDFDTAYNNGLAVPQVDDYIAGWLEKAPAFRASWPDYQLDLPYGEGARNIYDYFLPKGTPKGTLVLFTVAIGAVLINPTGRIWRAGRWHRAGGLPSPAIPLRLLRGLPILLAR